MTLWDTSRSYMAIGKVMELQLDHFFPHSLLGRLSLRIMDYKLMQPHVFFLSLIQEIGLELT